MCLIQLKHAQIKFPLVSFWTVCVTYFFKGCMGTKIYYCRQNVMEEWFVSFFLCLTCSMLTSNGKSSIVEERLYSFFFAFFQKKTKLRFFRFSSFTQLGTKTFVLLWSCKIFKRFASLCFVFPNFWNNPICFNFDFEKVGLIPFTSLCSSKKFGTTWSFLLRSSEV